MGFNSAFKGLRKILSVECTYAGFYVLLTVNIIKIFVNNQLDAQLLFLYSFILHVSSNQVLIISRVNCTNTTSAICHCM